MMSIELMYLGGLMSFVFFAICTDDFRASLYVLLFLILAACESAVGLGILIVLYRFDQSIDFDDFQNLAG